MPDRKKVKEELLELNAKAYGLWVHDQTNEFLAQIGNVTDDALALLKEQEAVEPIKPLDKDDDFTFLCSNCKGELFCGDVIRDNFCPTCGRSVKWDG